jgi:hypothetical protein
MPRATTCLSGGKRTSVESALDQRNAATRRGSARLDFRCVDCGKPVRPHKAGGRAEAHFEHLERNPHCPLSDPAR